MKSNTKKKPALMKRTGFFTKNRKIQSMSMPMIKCKTAKPSQWFPLRIPKRRLLICLRQNTNGQTAIRTNVLFQSPSVLSLAHLIQEDISMALKSILGRRHLLVFVNSGQHSCAKHPSFTRSISNVRPSVHVIAKLKRECRI